MTVSQLMASTSSAELTAWHTFFEVEQEKLEEARESQRLERQIGSD